MRPLRAAFHILCLQPIAAAASARGSEAPPRTPVPETAFMFGADLSSLPRVEAAAGVFREDGVATDALTALATRGLGWVRLRLWHSPEGGRSGLAESVALAARARDAGCRILLDLHFSDTWADPGRQDMPRAWVGLTLPALRDSVRAYARDVYRTFAAAGAPPAIVQLGNEISAGMLWDLGRVGGDFDSPEQWRALAGLLNAAAQGLAEGAAPAPRPRLLVHFDDGGDAEAAVRFFTRLEEEVVDYDLIGLSFYPWWHGKLSDLARTLFRLSRPRFGKEIVVVETGYPWTLSWFDDHHNIVGLESQLYDGYPSMPAGRRLGGYPATPAGQRAFLWDLIAVVMGGSKARGVF